MAQYIRRRLITAIPVFFGITMLVFLLVDLAPGDLTDLMGEGAASTVEQAAMEAAGIRIDRYSVDIYDAHAPYEESSTDNTWSSGQVPADQIP